MVITDNKFNDIPCGVGQHRHTKDGKYRNEDITITNNTITCSSKNKAAKIAITCIGINNLTVKNNIVKGPYQFAMHVMVADGVVIEGNQAEGMKQNGIMVDSGKNVVISNNTLKNIAKHGISIGGGTVKKVSGNKITNVKWNGISVDEGIPGHIGDLCLVDADSVLTGIAYFVFRNIFQGTVCLSMDINN